MNENADVIRMQWAIYAVLGLFISIFIRDKHTLFNIKHNATNNYENVYFVKLYNKAYNLNCLTKNEKQLKLSIYLKYTYSYLRNFIL